MNYLFQFVSRRLDVHKESSSIYVTLGFAGLALVAAMLVGVIVLKRRQGKHPHLQVSTYFFFFVNDNQKKIFFDKGFIYSLRIFDIFCKITCICFLDVNKY